MEKLLLVITLLAISPSLFAESYLCIGEQVAFIDHSFANNDAADIKAAVGARTETKFMASDKGVFIFGSENPLFSSCAVGTEELVKLECLSGPASFSIWANNLFFTKFTTNDDEVEEGYGRTLVMAGKCSAI